MLLSELSDVSQDKRSAHFICSICCVIEKDTILKIEGRCDGFIGKEKRGDNGFGYDPVFFVNSDKSFAELSDTEKDKYSHRGDALRKFYDLLKERKDKDNVNQ